MSYGLLLDNPSGRLVLTDEIPTPYLSGKLTSTQTLGPLQYDAGPWRYTTFVYPAPPSTGQYIYAQTLPSNGQGTKYTPVASSPSQTALGVFHLSGVIPAAPEVYRFRTDTVVDSGSPWGLQLRNPAGVLTFDAGHRHLMVSGVFERPYAQPGDHASLTLTGVPAKPCFILPQFVADRRVSFYREEGNTGNWVNGTDYWFYESTFWRNGNTLQFDLWLNNFSTTYGAIEDSETLWGTRNNAGIVMLNAATYD